jgi:hypothetical protein
LRVMVNATSGVDPKGSFMTGRFLESQQVEPRHSLDVSAKKR